MKIELLDDYFIDTNKPNSFILKKRYIGKRNGMEAVCDKTVSFHTTFEDASERFLSLYKGDKTDDRFISMTEYINAVREENRKAVEAVQESRMEHFFLYVPTGTGQKQEHSIVELIPVGSGNAISRNLLVQLCVQNGLIDESLSVSGKDRLMRRLIEHARIDYTILNQSDGRGYYRPSKEDLMELQKYIRQEESRAKSTFKNLSMAKKLYEDYKTGRL